MMPPVAASDILPVACPLCFAPAGAPCRVAPVPVPHMAYFHYARLWAATKVKPVPVREGKDG